MSNEQTNDTRNVHHAMLMMKRVCDTMVKGVTVKVQRRLDRDLGVIMLKIATLEEKFKIIRARLDVITKKKALNTIKTQILNKYHGKNISRKDMEFTTIVRKDVDSFLKAHGISQQKFAYHIDVVADGNNCVDDIKIFCR